MSISALAKPNPCNSPKQKAIIQGDFSFPSVRVISVARKTIVRAINASTVPCGRLIILNIVSPRVIL